ncbi:hypothetical protein BH09PSE6_BH09PSE6_03260 [soil metagenome]
MRRRLASPPALVLPVLMALFGLSQAGDASAQTAGKVRPAVHVSGQFKSSKESSQKVSDLLPQNIYDVIKSRNLSLMVYTKNFTFSNSKDNWCWAFVGVTTPSTDDRTERLAVNGVTGVWHTPQDADCRLKAAQTAIDDGTRLVQFTQMKELARTVPTGGKAPADPKGLMLYSAFDEQQTDWILKGFPDRFKAAFDPRQFRVYAGYERFVIGDDVVCIASAALTAASPDDRTPRLPPELEVGTALLPGGAKQKPADAQCWQAAIGGAFTRLLNKPWDTDLLAGVTAAREDWSRLPTPEGIRMAVAKFDKDHPPAATKAR